MELSPDPLPKTAQLRALHTYLKRALKDKYAQISRAYIANMEAQGVQLTDSQRRALKTKARELSAAYVSDLEISGLKEGIRQVSLEGPIPIDTSVNLPNVLRGQIKPPCKREYACNSSPNAWTPGMTPVNVPTSVRMNKKSKNGRLGSLNGGDGATVGPTVMITSPPINNRPRNNTATTLITPSTLNTTNLRAIQPSPNGTPVTNKVTNKAGNNAGNKVTNKAGNNAGNKVTNKVTNKAGNTTNLQAIQMSPNNGPNATNMPVVVNKVRNNNKRKIQASQNNVPNGLNASSSVANNVPINNNTRVPIQPTNNRARARVNNAPIQFNNNPNAKVMNNGGSLLDTPGGPQQQVDPLLTGQAGSQDPSIVGGGMGGMQDPSMMGGGMGGMQDPSMMGLAPDFGGGGGGFNPLNMQQLLDDRQPSGSGGGSGGGRSNLEDLQIPQAMRAKPEKPDFEMPETLSSISSSRGRLENNNTKRNNRKSGPNADLYTAHMKDLFEAAKNPKISRAEFEELHAEMREKYGNFSPAIGRLRNAREQRRLTNSGYTQKVEDLKRLAMNKGISDKDLETKLQALQKEHGDERYLSDHVKNIRALRQTLGTTNRIFPESTAPSTLQQEYARLREKHKNDPAKLKLVEQEFRFMKEKLRREAQNKQVALTGSLQHFNKTSVTNHDSLRRQYAESMQKHANDPSKQAEIQREYQRVAKHHENGMLQKLRSKPVHFPANTSNVKAMYASLRKKHAEDPKKLQEIEREYARLQRHEEQVARLQSAHTGPKPGQSQSFIRPDMTREQALNAYKMHRRAQTGNKKALLEREMEAWRQQFREKNMLGRRKAVAAEQQREQQVMAAERRQQQQQQQEQQREQQVMAAERRQQQQQQQEQQREQQVVAAERRQQQQQQQEQQREQQVVAAERRQQQQQQREKQVVAEQKQEQQQIRQIEKKDMQIRREVVKNVQQIQVVRLRLRDLFKKEAALEKWLVSAKRVIDKRSGRFGRVQKVNGGRGAELMREFPIRKQKLFQVKTEIRALKEEGKKLEGMTAKLATLLKTNKKRVAIQQQGLRQRQRRR